STNPTKHGHSYTTKHNHSHNVLEQTTPRTNGRDIGQHGVVVDKHLTAGFSTERIAVLNPPFAQSLICSNRRNIPGGLSVVTFSTFHVRILNSYFVPVSKTKLRLTRTPSQP